jgi:hypothetical protein
LHDRLDDGAGIVLGEKIMDEGAVDLDSIDRKSPQGCMLRPSALARNSAMSATFSSSTPTGPGVAGADAVQVPA